MSFIKKIISSGKKKIAVDLHPKNIWHMAKNHRIKLLRNIVLFLGTIFTALFVISKWILPLLGTATFAMSPAFLIAGIALLIPGLLLSISLLDKLNSLVNPNKFQGDIAEIADKNNNIIKSIKAQDIFDELMDFQKDKGLGEELQKFLMSEKYKVGNEDLLEDKIIELINGEINSKLSESKNDKLPEMRGSYLNQNKEAKKKNDENKNKLATKIAKYIKTYEKKVNRKLDSRDFEAYKKEGDEKTGKVPLERFIKNSLKTEGMRTKFGIISGVLGAAAVLGVAFAPLILGVGIGAAPHLAIAVATFAIIVGIFQLAVTHFKNEKLNVKDDLVDKDVGIKIGASFAR